MKKCLLILASFVSFQSIFSQEDSNKRIRHEVDSLKNILPKLKGKDKIDCLNALTMKYFDLPLGSWKAQADSARPYALQANKESKQTGYKKGIGYSHLNLETIDCMMFGTYAQAQKRFDTASFNSAQKNANTAISIGEELQDYELLGETYFVLEWLVSETRNTGNQIQYIAKQIDYAKKAIEYFGKTDNKIRLARSLEELYYIADFNQNFEEGVEAMKRAILLYRELGEWREVLASTNLTEMLLIKGEFENAFDYCRRIIDVGEASRKSSDEYRDFFYGQGFAHMTDLNILAGDYEIALQYIRKGRDFYPVDTFSMAVWSSNIGEVYRLMKNYDSALHYLKPFESMQALYALAGRIMKGKLRLTSLYISMNQYDRALHIINEMIKKADGEIRKTNNPIMIGLKGSFSINAAKAWLGKKDYQMALKYATEGIALLKAVNWKVTMIDNNLVLSDIYTNLNRNDSAYYYLKQYMVMKDSLLNRQFYFRLNNYKKQAEEERKTSQINLLNKENQLKEQKLKQEGTVKRSLIVVLILMSLLGVLIFRTLTLKRKNELQKQQLENEKKQAELQQKATELEMQALKAQMNPHFIFNCLSSINKFILKNDTDAASDYLTRFSRLIRLVLTNAQLTLIPLSDEIEMLRLYLDMERLRFSDSFDYNIIYENTIEPDTTYIPPMLLQPFCENAIWHGLMHKEGQGKLDIMMSIQNGELQCLIADNGIGRTKAAELKGKSGAKQKSFGLKLTTERLAIFNNDMNGQSSCNTEDVLDNIGNVAGTKVTLRIKLKNAFQQPVNEIV
jgi:Histidine kinase